MAISDKDRVKQAFAKRLLEALADIGYLATQQTDMKRLFGVSGQAVRKWAEGQSMPTTARMSHVADVLGVRRAWLQDGEEPMFPETARVEESKGDNKAKDFSSFSLSGEEIRLIVRYRTLSLAQRSVLQTLISVFLDKIKP